MKNLDGSHPSLYYLLPLFITTTTTITADSIYHIPT